MVFFTNQRVRKIVLEGFKRCVVVCQDSLAIKSEEVSFVNCEGCRFLFDQVSVLRFQCYNVKDCSFQFSNEEGSLLDEHRFIFDAQCSGNRVQKVSIIPGTDPTREPHLPLEEQKTTTVGENLGAGAVAWFTERGRSLDVVAAPTETGDRLPNIAQEIEQVRIFSSTVSEKLKTDQWGSMYEREVEELHDPLQVVKSAVKRVAAMLREAKGSAVLFAGAGISTSASLKDYRGPRGAWTRMAGVRVANEDGSRGGQDNDDDKLLSEASPTFGHYCVVELLKRGYIRHVLTTNMDALFVRAGVPAAQLSELHGNCFREYCTVCGLIHFRRFDTLLSRTERWSHITHRLCNKCRGPLRDSIVHFTEHWTFPEEVYKGLDACYASRLALVVGTSMIVQPSVSFPKKVLYHGGQMVLVNLQRTPADHLCREKIYTESDVFFAFLMEELGIHNVETGFDLLAHMPDDIVIEDGTSKSQKVGGGGGDEEELSSPRPPSHCNIC